MSEELEGGLATFRKVCGHSRKDGTERAEFRCATTPLSPSTKKNKGSDWRTKRSGVAAPHSETAVAAEALFKSCGTGPETVPGDSDDVRYAGISVPPVARARSVSLEVTSSVQLLGR